MATELDARVRLLALLRERAVLRGDFLLSSGGRSSTYLDARLVTLSSAGAGLVGTVLLDVFPKEVEGVAGLSVGADPIVAAVATVAGLGNRNIDGFIVRKNPKDHGTSRIIEGPWREGVRVAVVDDTFTTGSSALQAATSVQDAGGEVLGIWALIDREEGARRNVEDAGFNFHAIFRSAEIID